MSSLANDRTGGRPADETITPVQSSIIELPSGDLDADVVNFPGTQRDVVDDGFVSDNREPIGTTDQSDGRPKDSIPIARSPDIMRDRMAGSSFVDSRPLTASLLAHRQDISSDSESDVEGQSDDHLQAVTIDIDPEEELAARLLRGDISEVRRYLKDAPARQRGYVQLLQTQFPDTIRKQRSEEAGERVSDHEQESTIPHRNVTPSKASSASQKARARRTQRRASAAKPCLDDKLATTVTLPKAEHAKGRRLLVPSDKALPIAAIYMRGEAHFIDQTAR